MGRTKEHHMETVVAQASAKEGVVMHASPTSFPAVESWNFGAVKGEEVKSFPISSNGVDLMLSIQDCVSPFEPSSLNGATRKAVTLRLPSEWDDPLGDMENALIQLVCARSRDFFGVDLAEDQIIERYKPITKKLAKYPRNLKVKVATGFSNHMTATRYWSHDRTRIDAPTNHAGIRVNAVVRLCAIWVGKDAWGVVCDASDIQIMEELKVDCPF